MDKKTSYALLIFFSSLFFFLPFLGKVHLFDWDEINFAESAREMIVSGNYSRVQIDFKPFWEKPPLFFWLQAASMLIFGVNEFAARFPNAIIGIITLLTLYFIGKKLKDETFGLLWALSYLGSFLPHLYFKSGIIDPSFNYFIFLSIWFLYKSTILEAKKSLLFALTAGIFLGLATLTKGPVGLLIVCLSTFSYWASHRFKKITTIKNILVFSLSFIFISSLWFGIELLKNGPWFFKEFINYQVDLFLNPVAGHGEPFYYHFVVVFLGCFPISVWALPLLFKIKINTLSHEDAFQKWMLILFWTVMILFSIVKTKIVHYSSLTYFPLSYLSATVIYALIINKIQLKKYMFLLLATTGSIFSILLIGVPLIAQHKEWVIPFIKDKFAVACFKTPVMWNGFEFLIGTIYLLALVYSLFLISKQKYFQGAVLMFYSTAFCMFFYLATVVPKIEAYSQAPAINFYKQLAGKNVYVLPVGFKSYAHYFYFEKQPGADQQSSDEDWLLNKEIGKPAYFVSKITFKDFFDTKPQIYLIKQEGGFLFYRRNASYPKLPQLKEK